MITIKLDKLTLNIPDDCDVKFDGQEVTVTQKYTKYTYAPPTYQYNQHPPWLRPNVITCGQSSVLQKQTIGKCLDTTY